MAILFVAVQIGASIAGYFAAYPNAGHRSVGVRLYEAVQRRDVLSDSFVQLDGSAENKYTERAISVSSFLLFLVYVVLICTGYYYLRRHGIADGRGSVRLVTMIGVTSSVVLSFVNLWLYELISDIQLIRSGFTTFVASFIMTMIVTLLVAGIANYIYYATHRKEFNIDELNLKDQYK